MKTCRIPSGEMGRKVAKCVSVVVAICFISAMLLHSYRSSVREDRQAPEDVALEMFNAMERGDVKAYLSLLSDEARRRAELTLSEYSEGEFARQLRSMHDGIKGIAVSKLEQPSEDEVVLRVELVFESKNEVQYVRMKRVGGEWKVVEIMQSEHLSPPILYGTPVDRL